MTKTMVKPLIYLALISLFVFQTAKVPHAAPHAPQGASVEAAAHH